MNKSIYKYFKGDYYSVDALRNKYLWFSKPSYFNDPFDCSMEHLLAKDSQLSDEGKEFIRQNTKEFGICCFSEDSLSHHMWSIYANGYQGFCVEYDKDVIGNFCSENFNANCELMPCMYYDSPINLDDRITWESYENFIKEVPLRYVLECPKKTDRLFQMFLLQKNELVWKHEKEWRIILGGRAIKNGAYLYAHKSEGYKIPFPENAIKSIILGSNMKEIEEEKVRTLVQEVYSNKIPIGYLELDHNSWDLRLKK